MSDMHIFEQFEDGEATKQVKDNLVLDMVPFLKRFR